MAGWERLRWVDRVVRRNNPVLTGQEGSSLIITVNHVLIFLPRRTQFLMRRGMGGGGGGGAEIPTFPTCILMDDPRYE